MFDIFVKFMPSFVTEGKKRKGARLAVVSFFLYLLTHCEFGRAGLRTHGQLVLLDQLDVHRCDQQVYRGIAGDYIRPFS